MQPAVDPAERLLLTATEAAKLLAISPRSLWSLAARGEIAAVRIGRSVRYSPAVLREFIEARQSAGEGAR